MKTNILFLSVTAASAALVVPLSAQNRPQDLGVEERVVQAPEKRRDLALIPGKSDNDEEWDMVRRLEQERHNQSVDAMIKRMLRELESEAPQADKPNRSPQEMKERDRAPEQKRRMDELRRRFNETQDRQRPTWFIGLMVEPLEPFIREHLALESKTGVKVTWIKDKSPAAKAGIRLNDIIFKAGGKKVSSLEDLKTAVEKAGKEGKPLELGWIQKGQRKTAALRPDGPPRSNLNQRTDKPAMPGIERRMIEMTKRLDRQQKEIEALRRQVESLRPPKLRNRMPGNEANPNPRSR